MQKKILEAELQAKLAILEAELLVKLKVEKAILEAELLVKLKVEKVRKEVDLDAKMAAADLAEAHLAKLLAIARENRVYKDDCFM